MMVPPVNVRSRRSALAAAALSMLVSYCNGCANSNADPMVQVGAPWRYWRLLL